jgi:hypothetical protein
MDYQDTDNKAFIRQAWDLPILKQWQNDKNQKLSYFGLPGKELYDLRDWCSVLGKITGVEITGKTKEERDQDPAKFAMMKLNAQLYNLPTGFQILRGEIEDVIIDMTDIDGIPPQLNDGQKTHVSKLLYDIVNLDFFGGIGYADRENGVKRAKAVKKIIERQDGTNFILFITVNVRSKLHGQIESYLKDLSVKHSDKNWKDKMDWYFNGGKGKERYKFKAMVPFFIKSIAETHGFRCLCYPPLFYIGHKDARMIHFAFELKHSGNSFGAVSTQIDTDVIELPLIECRNSQLVLIEQHPGYDSSILTAKLSSFPNDIKDFLIALGFQ